MHKTYTESTLSLKLTQFWDLLPNDDGPMTHPHTHTQRGTKNIPHSELAKKISLDVLNTPWKIAFIFYVSLLHAVSTRISPWLKKQWWFTLRRREDVFMDLQKNLSIHCAKFISSWLDLLSQCVLSRKLNSSFWQSKATKMAKFENSVATSKKVLYNNSTWVMKHDDHNNNNKNNNNTTTTTVQLKRIIIACLW